VAVRPRTLKLSSSEKQTLFGPLAVGCLLGAFVAFATVAFSEEYERDGWQAAMEALVGFAGSVAGCAGAFGVLPVVVQRARSSKKANAKQVVDR